MFKKLLLRISALLIALPHAASAQAEWEVLEDATGRKIEARILNVGTDKVSMVRKSDGRKFDLEIAKFSEKTKGRFADWKKESMEKVEDGKLSKKLYPRTKDEVKQGLKDIGDREKPSNIDNDQFKAITELNIYRFLCGVPFEVEADPEIVDNCTLAAEACAKAGKLSHDLGDFTDKCNISTLGDVAATVKQYINDPGANNRDARGHRRWCLNPPMEITGFGSAGKKYSAMWAMNSEGERNEESWGYPGKGFFPIDRLHGTGWSIYLTQKAPSPSELTVKVFKLSKRPEKPFSTTDDDIPGKELPVPFVKTYQNAINFEPDKGPITSKGIYYVQIKGGGVKESYLVELY